MKISKKMIEVLVENEREKTIESEKFKVFVKENVCEEKIWC